MEKNHYKGKGLLQQIEECNYFSTLEPVTEETVRKWAKELELRPTDTYYDEEGVKRFVNYRGEEGISPLPPGDKPKGYERDKRNKLYTKSGGKNSRRKGSRSKQSKISLQLSDTRKRNQGYHYARLHHSKP